MTEQERLLRDTRLFVLDMDGTFYLGDRLLPGAADFLQAVTAAGKKYLFFTNNSSRAPEDYVRRLAGMGCPITREQMVAMLYRYAVFCGIPTTATGDLSQFPDGNRVSRYAVTAMEWAVEAGLIQGMDGALNPRGEATRVQIAAVITRFSKLPDA